MKRTSSKLLILHEHVYRLGICILLLRISCIIADGSGSGAGNTGMW